MKKALAAIFAFVLMLSMTAIAQDQSTAGSEKQDKKVAKAEKQEAKASEKHKALSLTGWVKQEGDKTVFVNDKDKQTWQIANADVLKPHEGQHVKVKATPDESSKTLTIDSVKEMGKSKQAKAAEAPPKS